MSKVSKAKIEEMQQKERARRCEAGRKMDEARDKLIAMEKARWEKAAADPTLMELQPDQAIPKQLKKILEQKIKTVEEQNMQMQAQGMDARVSAGSKGDFSFAAA